MKTFNLFGPSSVWQKRNQTPLTTPVCFLQDSKGSVPSPVLQLSSPISSLKRNSFSFWTLQKAINKHRVRKSYEVTKSIDLFTRSLCYQRLLPIPVESHRSSTALGSGVLSILKDKHSFFMSVFCSCCVLSCFKMGDLKKHPLHLHEYPLSTLHSEALSSSPSAKTRPKSLNLQV